MKSTVERNDLPTHAQFTMHPGPSQRSNIRNPRYACTLMRCHWLQVPVAPQRDDIEDIAITTARFYSESN